MRWVIIFIAVLVSLGCNRAKISEPASTPEVQSPKVIDIDNAEEDVSFEAILNQYRSLNQRLEKVSYKIQSANAALCPSKDRAVGMTVHTLSDYPENLQPYARGLLNVDERLSLRTVRIGSPAHKAGVNPGDQLLQVGGSLLPSGITAKTMFDALSQRVYAEEAVDITVQQGNYQITRSISPETICGYPVNLFFSEQINGHTDGEEVWITSELMRSLPDDVDLALVIAHEMAHAIAGHMALPPTKTLELEADRMALIMLARAEYDIDQAVENWANAPHPDDESNPSSTHPSQAERLAHFDQVKRDVQARRRSGASLTFSK